MEIRFLKDALFGGMTSNAFKLGTVLSFGWFWTRRGGCMILYRGGSFWAVDFENVLAVGRADDVQISPPAYLEHKAGGTYFYVVRRTNCCGYLEQGLQGVARVDIDAEGCLSKQKPNSVFGLKAEQADVNCIRLSWYYCPLEQQSEPVCFSIYSNGGAGRIDYENAAAVIEYKGRGNYGCQCGVSSEGRYRFAVRAQDKAGTEGGSKVCTVSVLSKEISSPEILDVEAV